MPDEIGQTCGELVTAHQRLRDELRTIDLDDACGQLGDEVARLLHYQQWLVRTALQLAFTISDNPRREPMRRRLTGTRTGDDLRRRHSTTVLTAETS